MNISEKEHEYGFIRDEKIYLKSFLDFPERQIGQVKESEEASIKYFEKRFEFAKQKVTELEKLVIEAQNKGSYLMKLVHMRKYLANFDGLGDYVSLFAKLDEVEEYLRDLIASNRIKNLEIKNALLEEAEVIYNSEDLKQASDDLKELKMKWIKTGSVVEEQQEAIEKKFEQLCEAFYEKRKNTIKNKSRLLKRNMNDYRRMLQIAEQLKNSDDFEDAFQQFRNLQQSWKNTGKIPHKKAVEFWDKFKRHNDLFFARYKKFKEFRMEFPALGGEQIKQKIEEELCIKAEALVNFGEKDNNNEAKELLIEWKKLSSVFYNLDPEIYNRFRTACDKIFEISYLMRVVGRKYPNIDSKPREDQYKIKISFMRELSRRDENELSLAESNFQKISQTEKNRYALQEMQNNLNIQKRKLKVKKQIISELEEALSELKK